MEMQIRALIYFWEIHNLKFFQIYSIKKDLTLDQHQIFSVPLFHFCLNKLLQLNTIIFHELMSYKIQKLLDNYNQSYHH